MNKKIKNILSIFIPILLGISLIAYSYTSFSPEQIQKMKHYFADADYFYVLLSGLLAFLGYCIRAYRWRYSLEYLGYQSDFKFNLAAVSICYLVNLTIPRSGEVSRAALLAKYRNVPFDKAFGTIVSERIVDLLLLIVFILSAVVLEFATLRDFLLEYISVKTLLIVLIVGIIGVLSAIGLLYYSKWSFFVAVRKKISGFAQGVSSVFRMPHKWQFLAQSVLLWVVYLMMFYMAIFALKDTRIISFGTLIVAFVIGSLVISFTNGGFGSFPVIIGKILVLYSIPEEAGQAFGWISWTSQFVLTILLGGVAFLFLPILANKKTI